jgi:hypothetical protein
VSNYGACGYTGQSAKKHRHQSRQPYISHRRGRSAQFVWK